MSNHTLEKQLDLVISLLETLPERMCDEIERRHEAKKVLEKLRLEADIEFHYNNISTLNKAIYGYEKKEDKEI